ncbi:MAG TPA: VOC family protein [Acidimicrobiales bacterium]|nr:VOC family protein [Acidimicrobiales bacterium]
MSVTLNPYINFNGDARAAMEFYRSVFGGELNVMAFSDLPEMPTDPEEKDKVMHAMLTGDNGIVLMGADTPNGQPYEAFNGSISLSGDDEAVLTGYFDKLSAGGEVGEPLTKAPWGDTFGMCTDRFGVRWLVNIAGQPG